jgi:hypothetical protein
MRLTSVSAAHWLYVNDEAAHRMSEQAIHRKSWNGGEQHKNGHQKAPGCHKWS